MYLFAKALDSFSESEKLVQKHLDCDSNAVFENGLALVNYIKTVSIQKKIKCFKLFFILYTGILNLQVPLNLQTEIKRITGLVKINENGERNSYTLQIIQVSPKERNKLGIWDPDTGIAYSRNITQMILDAEEFIANKTFIVSSILVRRIEINK